MTHSQTNAEHGRLVKNTVVLLLGVTVVGANAFLLSPVLKTVSESIDSSAQMTALAVSAYGGATALSGLFLSGLLQPYGYRTTLIVTGVMLTLGVGMTSIAPSLPMLILGQALSGLGAGVMLPTAYAATSVVAPAGMESRIMGRVIAGWSISLVLAVPASAFIANFTSWRWAYFIITFIAASAVVGFTTLPASRAQKRQKPSSIRDAIGVDRALHTLVMVFLYMCAFYGIYTFLGDYTQSDLNQSTAASGLVVLGYGAGFGLASFMGSIIDRYSPSDLIGPLLLCLCLLYLVGTITDSSLGWLTTWCILWGIVNQLGLNCLVTILTQLSSEHKIRLLGLYSVAAYGGAMIAAIVFGAIYNAAGFGAILKLASGLCFIGFCMAMRVHRILKRPLG